MATATAPKEPKDDVKKDKAPSPHADRVSDAEDRRREYDEMVQGKAPEFVPNEKKSDDDK